MSAKLKRTPELETATVRRMVIAIAIRVGGSYHRHQPGCRIRSPRKTCPSSRSDPQANSSIVSDPLTVERSVYELMMDGQAPIEQAAAERPSKTLSWYRTDQSRQNGIEIGDFDAPFRLKDRLEPACNQYEVIVIDTPPVVTYHGECVSGCYTCFDTHPVFVFCLEGTDDLLETIEKVKARPNPNLELLV